MRDFETIQEFVQKDAQLARLFEKAKEYAELYIIAKQRQKGCDGMGEVATLKDEFMHSLNEMIRFCKAKDYLLGDVSYDIDLIAHDICEIQSE